MSFSPHTDAKGIMDLVGFLSPKHVVLVHGEKPKMAILKKRIESELGIPCFDPANNEAISVPAGRYIRVEVTKSLLRRHDEKLGEDEEGILVMKKNRTARIASEGDLLRALDAEEHSLRMALCCPVRLKRSSTDEPSPEMLGELLLGELKSRIGFDHFPQMKSFRARVCSNELCAYRMKRGEIDCGNGAFFFFCCSWSPGDDALARKLLGSIGELELHVSPALEEQQAS